MSIQVLTQVYDEMRRLAIAGSVVAPGDFRLKKLIPPLEQSGAKAPVFAKVADAVKKVVDGDEKSSATNLLELATLVNAILYTQGETGVAGEAAPIETTDMGAMAQTSARTLKPLLEALTTTGAGRLELIRDAFERGLFRDLRLVKPALDAIDDPYGEIGDLIAEKVLPIYGKAIVPELRAKLDIKGKAAGHPRRLRLLHEFDPAGTRALIQQALDEGSKEVKVVAIECLGADAANLSYLIEQASAKAQDVRLAAYRALATIDDDAAVTVLQKAIAGKDVELAADAISGSKNAKLVDQVIMAAQADLDALTRSKDRDKADDKLVRLQALMRPLHGRDDSRTEAFVLGIFERRGEITKLKGSKATSRSGYDLLSAVVDVLAAGSKKMRAALAEAHGDLYFARDLGVAFGAARAVLPAERVFELFSPYVSGQVDLKKKRTQAADKYEAIVAALGGRYRYWGEPNEERPPLDPRWLDVAVSAQDVSLVRELARPGHAGVYRFLKETLAETLKKAKSLHDCHDVVAAMIRAEHPEATDAFIAALEKLSKSDYYTYWFMRLVPELPKSALPRLEALLPTLGDRAADSLLDGIQQLREKK